jgi:transglutaminase/protease-like cytokinesis protein 3
VVQVKGIVLLVLLSIQLYAQPKHYAKADSIAALYPDHSLKDLKLLSKKLTSSLTTDKERFRSIYKWVCQNIEYDLDLYDLVNYKRARLGKKEFIEWNLNESPAITRLLIDKHRAVCTGYAWLVRELCYHAGISCEVVDGSKDKNARFPSHSWNAVLLNGKWYLADPTWSSGFFVRGSRVFFPQFEEDYFLADPKVFARNHYPLKKVWTLMEL